MLDKYDVTITKPYYIAEFLVTEQQFKNVTGNNPSVTSDKNAASISWDTVRGKSDIHNWPTVKTVDPKSFIGLLRARTGLILDLPTEAQWEFGWRSTQLKIVGKYHEWCLDWWTADQFLHNGVLDPEGPAKSRNERQLVENGTSVGQRVIRPGKSARTHEYPKNDISDWGGERRYRGVRLCMTPNPQK